MSKLIRLKIDVMKIIRESLYKGEKGTYLDASFFLEDEADEYGNHGCIRQDIGKETRERGEKGPILGNAKVVQTRQQQAAPPQRQQPQQRQREADDFDGF